MMYSSSQQPEHQIVRGISQSLADGAGWMKFLGVLSIISGIFQVLSLVGVISGGIQIWMGVLLNQAASSAEMARATGDSYALSSALGSVKTYFMINGILTLIGIILACAAVAFLVILPMFGLIPFLIDPNSFR